MLRVRVVDAELRVGGHGAPLDAAGVAALASLRASAKRGDTTVGRFGVGFAAVTALTDAPRLVTRRPDGSLAGVAFDRAATVAAVASLGGGAADELARRDGGAPALRLVWPDPDPAGLDDDLTTEVRLPLARADPAPLLARARREAPDLLLALPGLAAVDVAGTVVAREDDGPDRVVVGGVAWRVVRTAGVLPRSLDADRAVEDRERPGWSATWALRENAPGRSGEVLHAPTPTDEATTLPARLIATVPLDPDRRHVRSGPVTTHVLRAAAAAYPALVAAVPPEDRPALVPRPALPASEVDAVLRDAVLAGLAGAAWIPAADGGEDLVPSRALVLDVPGDGAAAALAAVLADVLAGLADPVLSDPRHAPALAAVGVTRLGPAALCDRLAGLDRPPGWWRRLYAALGGTRHDDLAALPVPLADGRTVIGPRGTLVPGGDLDPLGEAAAAADVPGLRVVHPDATHPLLLALGARRADAAALLAEPALLDAVERSVDDAEAGLEARGLADLVLALVAAAPPAPGTATALGALALPDADGEHRRADELVLPDGALRGLLGPDGPLGVLDPALAAATPRAALRAVGVLDGFAVLHDEEPTGPDHDLDDEEAWWAEEVDPTGPGGPDPGAPGPVHAVRDLDLVDPDRWPAAWPLLAGDRDVRAALAAAPGGPRSYTAWWLARHARLAGRPPTAWALPGGDAEGLFDPVPPAAAGDLDAAFLAAVGVRTDLTVRDAAEAADLLDRLADPARAPAPATVLAAHAALVAAVRAGRLDVADVEPPPRVRTADGGVRAADPAHGAPPVVLDRPWLAGVIGAADLVPAPGSDARLLADLLDLPVASERVVGEVRSPGTPTPWARLVATAAVETGAWAAALDRPLPPGEVVLHERLRVAVVDVVDGGRRGAPREAFPGVWVADGVVHTDDPVRALLAAWAADA